MTKLFIQVLPVLLCLAFTLSACKTDKKAKTTTSPNQGATVSAHKTVLSPADLVPGKLAAVANDEEFVALLQETTFVYANEPTAGQAEQCMRDLYDKSPIVSKLGEFVFSVTIDATACTQSIFSKQPGNKINVERTSIVVSELMRCESVDFSKFNGQKLSSTLSTEYQSSLKEKNCARFETMSQVKVSNTFSASVETDGKTQAYRATQHTMTYVGKSDLTPCLGTVTGGVQKLESGCVGISRKYYSEQTVDGVAAELEGEIYLKLEAQGLTSPLDGVSVWHSAGQLKATFNSCEGNLVYSSPSNAPTYSLSCPSGLKSSGTLSAKLKLGLVGNGSKTFPSFPWKFPR